MKGTGAMPEQEDVTTEETEEAEGGESGQDGDGLGDAGRKALDAERKARREAAKELRTLKAELEALRAQQASAGEQDQAKQAVEQARRDAEQAATVKANARILAAEVRAAAAGKLADPADAMRFLDLSQFEVGDDGSVDAAEISDAISGLIKDKPYLAAKASGFQGTGDGGARGNGGRARQLTEADLRTMSPEAIVKARQEGRLATVLGG